MIFTCAVPLVQEISQCTECMLGVHVVYVVCVTSSAPEKRTFWGQVLRGTAAFHLKNLRSRTGTSQGKHTFKVGQSKVQLIAE